MKKCLNCKYFNPECDACENDNVYSYYEIDPNFVAKECEYFVEKTKCKHRYENCNCGTNNNCSVLCHQKPSEHGCYFNYCCDFDDCLCDENCRPHELRHELEHEKENLHKMFDTKMFMEKMIEETKLKIEKLENEVKNI